MSAASRTLFDDANLGRDAIVVKNDASVATSDAFDERVRKLCIFVWGRREAVAQLSIHGDVTVRQAQRIMARDNGFSLDVYLNLMRSPYGKKFFDLAMDGSQSEWARETRQGLERSELLKQRRELEKKLKAMEEA